MNGHFIRMSGDKGEKNISSGSVQAITDRRITFDSK